MVSVRTLAITGCVVGLLVLGGCGEEPVEVDSGADSSLRAGAADRLAAADVDVVSLASPTRVSPDEVSSALDDAGLSAEPVASDDDALSIRADQLVGIPTILGDTDDLDDGGSGFAAVVFAAPADAWTFAASRPEVFADAGAESDRAAYLAGPVVAFATSADGDDVGDDVRRALAALVPEGESSPSASPTD